MEPEETLISNQSSQESSDNSRSSENNSVGEKVGLWKKFPALIQDIIFGALAFLLAYVVYKIAKAIFPSEAMAPWVYYVCGAVVSGLFFGIFNAVQKEETRLKNSVILALTMFLFINIASDYFTESPIPRKDGVKVDYVVLKSGRTYEYDLKAGESTPWRAFPQGLCSYGVYSEDYQYKIIFNDGTSYDGDGGIVIPKKKKAYFKIKAKTDQKVFVTIF